MSTVPSDPNFRPAAGPHVPGFELQGELGRCGMGVVYRAVHLDSGDTVALKTASGADGGWARRVFAAEADALRALDYPNIVRFHEAGEAPGVLYLAMEYVEGRTLQAQLAGGPLDVAYAAGLVGTLAGAAHHAHERGVVHRDLKPDNVLVGAAGVPKITDFGLNKRLGRDDLWADGDYASTPGYSAPEQAWRLQSRAGPATDVHALGLILYVMLTGQNPYRAATDAETLRRIVQDAPVPPSALRPDIPGDLERVCLRCLAKDPADRYATARDLAEALGRPPAGVPVPGGPGAGAAAGDTAPRAGETTALDRMLLLLPPGQQRVLYLSLGEGLGVGEIAVALNLPPATVRQRLARGRAELLRLMSVARGEGLWPGR